MLGWIALLNRGNMDRRISIIHPSFGRSEQAVFCHHQWVMAETNYDEIEWIISLSSNDPDADDYYRVFDNEPVTIIMGDSTNMVQASNAAAERSQGDILVLVSDDMFPPIGWDTKLIERFDAYGDEPVVLQVFDGIRSDIVTLPIMNRLAYEKLGYLYHPAYISMFADNDLAETARKHGFYRVDKNLEFDHRHYTVGKSKLDKTYQKENSKIAWDHGQRVFEHRKRNGFPI